MKRGAHPIAAFTIPPHPPEPVAVAYARFDRVANEWGATQGAIDDARAAAKAAKAAATRAVADAVKAGKPSTVDPAEVEREHAATLRALEEKLAALTIAVDETGNALCSTIGGNRQPWIEALDAVAQEAAIRYRQALQDARAALLDLAPARGAVDWITNFEPGPATIGRQAQWAGGRMYCDTTSVRRETDAQPLQLLDVLGRIADERAPLTTTVPMLNPRMGARL